MASYRSFDGHKRNRLLDVTENLGVEEDRVQKIYIKKKAKQEIFIRISRTRERY